MAGNKRGPAPMPIELAHRLGDPGHRNRDVQPADVGTSIDVIDPPDSLPPEGQDMWRDVLPTLAKYGGLRDVDLPAIYAMCTHWARAQRLTAVLNEQGYSQTGSTGQMVTHPFLRESREEFAAYLRYAREFGLTWIARSQLGLSEAHRSAVLAGLEGDIGSNPRG